MHGIDSNLSVGALVREKPSRSRVFDRHGIDFCCGGKVSLARACAKRELPLEDILQQLSDSDAHSQDRSFVDADAMTLTELCDHIEATHHAYLKSELPRLDQMTEKVSRVHGDKNSELHQLRLAFVGLRDELVPHMMKEEQVLFPIIRRLESSTTRPEIHCGSVNHPIHQMEHEHDQAGESLRRIREAAEDFVAPEWACNTYRAMLDGLRELEANMHQHVHKENNVLFMKAAQLEADLETTTRLA